MYNQAEETLEPIEYYIKIGDVEITFSREYTTVKQPISNLRLARDYLLRRKRFPKYFTGYISYRYENISVKEWVESFMGKVEEDGYAVYHVRVRGVPVKPFVPWSIPSLHSLYSLVIGFNIGKGYTLLLKENWHSVLRS